MIANSTFLQSLIIKIPQLLQLLFKLNNNTQSNLKRQGHFIQLNDFYNFVNRSISYAPIFVCFLDFYSFEIRAQKYINTLYKLDTSSDGRRTRRRKGLGRSWNGSRGQRCVRSAQMRGRLSVSARTLREPRVDLRLRSCHGFLVSINRLSQYDDY